jgi:hypothetical protein
MHQSNFMKGKFHFHLGIQEMKSVSMNFHTPVELLSYYEFLFWISHIQFEMYDVIHSFIIFIFSDDQN